MTSTSSTTERAQSAASTAQNEGTALAHNAAGAASDVAHLAADRTSETAGEATAQAKDLLRQAKDDVNSQVDAQRRRLVDVLRTTGDEFGSTGGGQSALTAELTSRASEQARRLADYLDAHGPDDVLADVRRFARRRPGTFLLLAGVAGVVAGRVFRGVSAASDRPKASPAAPELAAPELATPTGGYEIPPPIPAYDPPPLVPPAPALAAPVPAPGLTAEPVTYQSQYTEQTSPYPTPVPPATTATDWQAGTYPEDVAVGTAPVPAAEDYPLDPLPGTYGEPREDRR